MTTTDHDETELDEAGPAPVAEPVTRPLAVTGIVAAVWAAGIGLTVLTTITLIGWSGFPILDATDYTAHTSAYPLRPRRIRAPVAPYVA